MFPFGVFSKILKCMAYAKSWNYHKSMLSKSCSTDKEEIRHVQRLLSWPLLHQQTTRTHWPQSRTFFRSIHSGMKGSHSDAERPQAIRGKLQNTVLLIMILPKYFVFRWKCFEELWMELAEETWHKNSVVVDSPACITWGTLLDGRLSYFMVDRLAASYTFYHMVDHPVSWSCSVIESRTS